MDWLVQYNAQLDCKTKMVKFHILGKTTLRLDVRGRLVSSALVSSIRVTKLLSKEVQDYLTFLIYTPTDKLKIENVSIVKEYSDMFPDKLVTLSQEREI